MRGSAVIDRAPPSAGTGHDGGGGGWAWLLTANGIIEANLIRGLLERHGIAPVHLDAHDPSPGSWLFLAGNVNALVRIYVLRSQLDDARLAMLEVTPPAGEAERPPVSRPARGSWMRIAWIVIAAAIVLAFGSRLFMATCELRAAC